MLVTYNDHIAAHKFVPRWACLSSKSRSKDKRLPSSSRFTRGQRDNVICSSFPARCTINKRRQQSASRLPRQTRGHTRVTEGKAFHVTLSGCVVNYRSAPHSIRLMIDFNVSPQTGLLHIPHPQSLTQTFVTVKQRSATLLDVLY